MHSDYRDLRAVLDARGIDAVDGALADLGVSSMQFDAEGRGFSFRRDEPLDMRMDQTQGPTAADLLAGGPAKTDLADVIYQFGEERFSRRIARRIVEARRIAPIATTGRLAEIVRRAVPAQGLPADRSGDADVSGAADLGQSRARRPRCVSRRDIPAACAAGARLAVITFHSLEDRIVKHVFRALATGGDALRVLTRKPVVPGDDELARNPRARSAKLRAIERLA